MLSKIALELKTFALFVLMGVFGKLLFFAFHGWGGANALSLGDVLSVLWHGLPLDLSCAGFFTIVPALFTAISPLFMPPGRVWDAYFAAASAAFSLIAVADTDVYGFWGTHMDAPTILFYLRDPGDVAASFTPQIVVRDTLLICLFWALSWTLWRIWVRRGALLPSSDVAQAAGTTAPKQLPKTGHRALEALLLALLGALLFIPIRGGFSTATMNVGRVYFSQNAFLNHAAINPVWNFLDSFNWKRDFAEQYRFMDAEKARALFDELQYTGARPAAGAPPSDGGTENLKVRRPNILLIILESFSGRFIAPLGGEAGVMPNMSALFGESIAFTRAFASGTRTDSGLVAILSGLPAQPKSRIMARPDKSLALPSLGKSLRAAGYDLGFYYGGDADFANMRSYLVGHGFETIVGERDFPQSEMRTKWGVFDHVLYERLLQELAAYPESKAGKAGRPFFKAALSLTSHEPFAIPTQPQYPGDDRVSLYKSSLFYADSALGDFLRKAKEAPWWKDTLVILAADHATPYPDMKIHELRRYRIPLLWTGGAIREPKTVGGITSQTDIAATLLGELGIGHAEFKFSKDVLDGNAPEYAFFTFAEGFGLADSNGYAAFDAAANRPALLSDDLKAAMAPEGLPNAALPPHLGDEPRELTLGKAYLQTLFDELAALNMRK